MEHGKGFWSYVHKDDAAEHGRILQLANDIRDQYEMITGDTISLFIDRDSLDWGDNWKDGVDAGLSSTVFFIPIITPRFFNSSECRRELNVFANQAEKLGVKDLIMPILYVDVPQIHADKTGDESMDLVKLFQWENWTELRFSDRTSPEYRRAVVKLAQKLAERNQKLDDNPSDDLRTSQTSKGMVSKTESSDNDTPGTMDVVATMMTTLPKWTDTTKEITTEINNVDQIFRTGITRITALQEKRAPYTEQLSIIKRIASQLFDPAEKISTLGNDFNSQLYEVDLGLRYLLVTFIENENAKTDENEKFFKSVLELGSSIRESKNNLEYLLEQMRPLEEMSRDLRKPIKIMRKGLTLILEGQNIVDDWTDLAKDILKN